MTREERFWAKVQRGGPDECWEWRGWRHTFGYGVMARAKVLTHRYSWEIHFGPIPAGQSVCHRCDNPPCVNPRHLFLGSQADNARDMWAKARGSKPPRGHIDNQHGEANRMAKLTGVKVDDIRRLYATGRYRQRQLAAMFGIKQQAISKIVRNQRWAA